MNYPMISKRYVIASADPEFIGPLTSGYLGNNKKYISEFEISSSVGLRNNLWNRSDSNNSSALLKAIRCGDTELVQKLQAKFEETKRERLPKVIKNYTYDPSKALLFDHFEADIVSFILNSAVDRRSYAFSIEESHAFEHAHID